MNKNGLSLSSSSLFKPIPKTDNADSKNQQQNCLFMRIMKMKSWIVCVGIRAGMCILRALFFVFARAHRFAHCARTRNREINHCALICTYVEDTGVWGVCTFGAFQPTAKFSKTIKGTYFWRGTYLRGFTVL